MPTREQYDAAFERERRNVYPVINEFEARLGFAVGRERLEAAARVLACPVKKNPPNWMHGRVIYALGRKYLTENASGTAWLDIGSAKSFSACVMSWAIDDAGRDGIIQSIDIIDPNSREPRNSVEDGKTIDEFAAPFRAAGVPIVFEIAGQHRADSYRIGFAFIDGSHTYDGVKSDISVVTPRQQSGDIILFDDVNKEQVNLAVREMAGYDIEYLRLLPQRAYAIATKK